MEPIRVPYGSWPSPISAQQVAAGGVSLSQLRVLNGRVHWIERRPRERGRSTVMVFDRGPQELAPPDFDVRSRVYEYGGGSYTAIGSTLFVCRDSDQRVYPVESRRVLHAITPEPQRSRALRYSDFWPTIDGNWLLCVRERHVEGREAINDMVAVSTTGAEPRLLVEGSDFYCSPRTSPDGRWISWLSWKHPNMPWDGCELWLARLDETLQVHQAKRVAGGIDESIFQPEWSPDGVLHFVSDRTGWWNLYALKDGQAQNLCPMEAEFGTAMWVPGLSRYAFLANGRIACVITREGIDHLGIVEPGSTELRLLDLPYTWFGRGGELASDGHSELACVVGSPSIGARVLRLNVDSGEEEILQKASAVPLDESCLSIPEPIQFGGSGGDTAHALFYPPRNDAVAGTAGDKPPLLVLSHGGPTGSTSTDLNPGLQYFTSRGFAVVDVNYGGSTGYGRRYRERLNGQWGVVDVEDCVAAARYLVSLGLVDPKRLAIRGGSAGGYTTLCALTFHDVFSAGASYYGVADPVTLTQDTHKFESRYGDSLFGGSLSEALDVYRARSPLHHIERLNCPIIVFQGLEDPVVLPSQAEMMAEALQRNGIPYAYVPFEGEGHGFRRAETVQRALEAELYFYARVWGMELSDQIRGIVIENL